MYYLFATVYSIRLIYNDSNIQSANFDRDQYCDIILVYRYCVNSFVKVHYVRGTTRFRRRQNNNIQTESSMIITRVNTFVTVLYLSNLVSSFRAL